jgi:hypothetical protein
VSRGERPGQTDDEQTLLAHRWAVPVNLPAPIVEHLHQAAELRLPGRRLRVPPRVRVTMSDRGRTSEEERGHDQGRHS